MSSNLKVNTVLPSVGTAIGIGTAGGSVSITSDTITALTGGSERLRIASNGRVGINTDSPSRLLEINTTGTSTEGIVVRSHDNTYPKLDFGANRTNADAFLGMITANWNGTYVADILFESGSDTTNKDDGLISFRTAESGGTRQERLRITSTGQFLMGATSTSDANIKMLIQGSGTTILRVNNTDDGTATLALGNTGSSNGAITQSGGHMTFSIANTERLRINSSGHTLPGSNNTYDLGSSSLRWRDIYTNDLHLSNQGSTNSVDNTWGDYTIQEGESDLFLINNRNGKKYKFNLTEVS